jgi:hypothetical protein
MNMTDNRARIIRSISNASERRVIESDERKCTTLRGSKGMLYGEARARVVGDEKTGEAVTTIITEAKEEG